MKAILGVNAKVKAGEEPQVRSAPCLASSNVMARSALPVVADTRNGTLDAHHLP